MTGKEFEQAILYRIQQEEQRGRACCCRYGVQGSFRQGQPIDVSPFIDRIKSGRGESLHGVLSDLSAKVEAAAGGWQPIQSLPDFTGILAANSIPFDFDAKVCSSRASFPLSSESKTQSRQLRHMFTRAKFGAVCFYAIHFPERVLATRTDDAQTWAFPIHPAHPFWLGFERGEHKSITREDCQEYATPIYWTKLPGGRTARPDVISAVEAMDTAIAMGALK